MLIPQFELKFILNQLSGNKYANTETLGKPFKGIKNL